VSSSTRKRHSSMLPDANFSSQATARHQVGGFFGHAQAEQGLGFVAARGIRLWANIR